MTGAVTEKAQTKLTAVKLRQTSCVGGRHNMPRPLQRKRAAAALSQAGRAGPDESLRAIPAGRPDVRDRRQTDRHQTPVIA